MKLTDSFLVCLLGQAAAAAVPLPADLRTVRYVDGVHDDSRGSTVNENGVDDFSSYSPDENGNPNFDDSASQTCPVTCSYNGKIRVQHDMSAMDNAHWIGGINSGTDGEQIGGVEPESFQNKIFHRCWHRGTGGDTTTSAGSRSCSCQCAQWETDECDTAACPTACGHAVSELNGVRDVSCFFGSDELSDSQCLASAKPPTECSTMCPATGSCTSHPTSYPTPTPTTYPTPSPTTYPTPTPTTYPTPYPTKNPTKAPTIPLVVGNKELSSTCIQDNPLYVDGNECGFDGENRLSCDDSLQCVPGSDDDFIVAYSTPDEGSFSSVTSTPNGMRIFATLESCPLLRRSQSCPLLVSSDAGATFSSGPYPQHKQWSQVAVSDDGMTVALVNEMNAGYVRISLDGGATLLPRCVNTPHVGDPTCRSPLSSRYAGFTSAPNRYNPRGYFYGDYCRRSAKWANIAMSGNGNAITATNKEETKIFSSLDKGLTWTEFVTQSPRAAKFTGVAVSSDGVHQAVVGRQIYLSHDSGVSWALASGLPSAYQTSSGVGESICQFTGVTISADGSQIAACCSAENHGGPRKGFIWMSSDSGATWTKTGPVESADGTQAIQPKVWSSISSSSDGTHLAAMELIAAGYCYYGDDCNTNGTTWKSDDSGVTWKAESAALTESAPMSGCKDVHVFDGGSSYAACGAKEDFYLKMMSNGASGNGVPGTIWVSGPSNLAR